jgi:hypothetical protein
LDENRKLERCLAIITELANGEKDHSPSVVDLSDHGEDVDTPAMTPTTQPLSLSIRSESAIANDSQANEGQSAAMTTTHENAAKTKARSGDSSSIVTSRKTMISEQKYETDDHEQEAVSNFGPSKDKNTKTKKSASDWNLWSNDEMRILYRLRHAIGISNWIGIAATGMIPNKTIPQMTQKWSISLKNKWHNPLERAFKDGRAKVAKQIGDDMLTGIVTDYDTDTETCEGIWTISYEDGTTEVMKKKGLLAALDLYDGNS